MQLRKLVKNDLNSLVSLYSHLHQNDPKVPQDYLELTWDKSEKCGCITYWGLFESEVLISSCQCIFVPNLTRGCQPYCLIENVVTHKDYRTRGYGKALLKHALDAAWLAGCYKVMLMTGRQGQDVFNFYKSVGFDDKEKHAFVAKPKLSTKKEL